VTPLHEVAHAFRVVADLARDPGGRSERGLATVY
jgi:hypothetical protein